jgi:DNA-binding transcriptional LysR family regulator
LAQHAVVSVDEGLSNIPVIRWLRQYVPDEAVVFHGSSIVALYAAARHGFGLTVLPRWLGDREPGLVRVFIAPDETWTPLWLLTHRELRHTARVRAFMDYMATALGKQRPMPEYGGGPHLTTHGQTFTGIQV